MEFVLKGMSVLTRP